MIEVPPLRVRTRLRPVELIAPRTRRLLQPGDRLAAQAPYVALERALERNLPGTTTRATVTLSSAGHEFTAHLEDGIAWLSHNGRRHRSRRHGKVSVAPTGIALTLTGVHITVLTCEAGEWVARARLGLREHLDSHDPDWLSTLVLGGDAAASGGEFGQLGLRDIRLATLADGSPYSPDGALWFTATHAGPGFFDTAHSGLWRLLPDTWQLTHEATHFFTRPGGRHRRRGVYGDHASHLISDGDTWLLATSTWGDFDRDQPQVEITLSTSTADLTHGTHVLDSTPLRVAGLVAKGSWDPHLMRTDDGWLLGLACAKKFFDFGPAIAQGPRLDSLALRARDQRRRATEGTTLVPTGPGRDDWAVLASDGRDGRRGQRAQFVVMDLDLRELGSLDAPYPSNIGWPSVARTPSESRRPAWTMLTFNGVRRAGELAGYGTHGDLVIMQSADDPGEV